MVQRQDNFSELEAVLQYRFADRAILKRALTHTSAVSPGRRVRDSYQRLEFLGDRVLGLVAADLLFKRLGDAKEGELARALNSVVRKETCAAVAADLGLGPHILMDKSEARNGGREKPSVLADVCEAVIGAIYMDGGHEKSYDFVERTFGSYIIAADRPQVDAKTILQEWAQGNGHDTPQYTEVNRTGPAHNPVFSIAVRIEGFEEITALGPSKKAAEQGAAELFLKREGILGHER